MRKMTVFIFKPAYLLALAVVVAGLISGCSGSTASLEDVGPIPTLTPTPQPTGRGAGGTLRLLYWQAPNTLNPHLTTTTTEWNAARIVYEPLASFDKDGNLIPFLAAEIPTLENGGLAEDGRSVTWKLKQDVRWSDSRPFTADDVLFTYEYITNPEVGSTSVGTYSAVDSVEVLDDYTVKVNFTDVNPAWSLPFVGIQGSILPRHIFEPYNNAQAGNAPANTLPVGTGPYRALEPGIKPQEVLFLGNELFETNKIVFEPNPHFRERDKPFFSRVELRGGSTNTEAARSVLKTGEVDFAWNLLLDAAELEALQADGAGQIIPNLGQFVERIYFNQTDPVQEAADGENSSLEFLHPFFSDKRVREAFSYAINREAIAALFGPAGQTTSNVLVSPAQYNSSNTGYEYNLDKARALLEEAGWADTNGDGVREKDGQELKVVYQTTVNPVRQDIQQIVKNDLETIGVEVELKLVDGSIFFGTATHPNDYRRFSADLQMYNDGNANPDPGSYMEWWTCAQIPQKSNGWVGENVQRWCNPEYDALFEQSRTEVDPDKRRQLFIQMNDMIINEFVLIPLVNRGITAGASKTLEGLDPTPWDMDTWNIKDWRRVSL